MKVGLKAKFFLTQSFFSSPETQLLACGLFDPAKRRQAGNDEYFPFTRDCR
jgi:hypothetical protein